MEDRQQFWTVDIEPGDQQAKIVILLPAGCPLPTKARVVVQRDGLLPIETDLEVHEVAA